jgi:hypothetical protein
LAAVVVYEKAGGVYDGCNGYMKNNDLWPFKMPLAVYEDELVDQ